MDIENRVRKEIQLSAMSAEAVGLHAGVTGQTIRNFLSGGAINSTTLNNLIDIFNIKEQNVQKMDCKLAKYLKKVQLDTDPRYYFILIENKKAYIKPMDRVVERPYIEVALLDRCQIKSLRADVKAIDDDSYFFIIESTDLYDQLRLPFHDINYFK